MKKLKKKYWVIIGVTVLLLLFCFIWNLFLSSTTFDDLDPEDYKDSPALKEVVTEIKNREPSWPRVPKILRVKFGGNGTVFSPAYRCHFDPRYFDLLVMCLNAEPAPKTPQFLKYLYRLCLFRDGYEWKILISGDYYYDGNTEIRCDACTALGNLEDKRVFDLLVGSLRDDKKEVRIKARNALIRIEDERVLPFFIKKLKDENPEMRSHACFALGEIGSWGDSQSITELLAERLEDEVYNVRRAAVLALAKFGDKRAIPVPKEKQNYKGLQLVP